MLSIKVSLENKQVVINGLDRLAGEMPSAVKRGLHRIGGGLYGIALQWLSGAGGQTRSYIREWSAGGEMRRKKNMVPLREAILSRYGPAISEDI